MTDVISLADQAQLLDASSMAAAESFYANTARLGVAIRRPHDVRKSRNWKVFQQIARKCMIAKVDVERFVTAAFESVVAKHPLVVPSDINRCDPRTIFRSKDGIQSSASPKDLWNLLSCKLLDIVFAIDGEKKSRIELLDNPLYGFPAWFRVFFPEVASPDIIVHWGDLAFDELKEDPQLDLYLSKQRPDTYTLLLSVVSKVAETKAK